jgi:hypothetical protein
MRESWKEHGRKGLWLNLIHYPNIFLERPRKGMKILRTVGSQPRKTIVQYSPCSMHTYCHVMSEYRLGLVS